MMTILLVSFISYSAWLYLRPPAAAAGHSALADKGKMLWQRHNCIACHQVYGLGGYLGPDLTNVYARGGAAYIKAFLMKGTAVMPDFRLTEPEMESIVAYLKAVDASGSADPTTFTIHADGTITQ